MWDVPVYRVRAYLRNIRKQRARGPRERPTLHLKRVAAEIRVLDGFAFPRTVLPARVMLNDIAPRGITLFSAEQLRPGQEVAITIEEPYRFYARGRVVISKLLSLDQNIISEIDLAYRIVIKWQLVSQEEQASVNQYCDLLLRNHIFGGY